MCENSKIPNKSINLYGSSKKLNKMPGKRKRVTCKNNTVKPKRKPVSAATSKLAFNDMCDDVIDMILSTLRLEDLANISDTSIRLRAIAISVFSRRYAHRLLSLDSLHFSNRPCGWMEYPTYSRNDSLVGVADVKIWFKLVRNFGASLKHISIHNNNFLGISSQNASTRLIKHISEYCNDKLETFEVKSSPSVRFGTFLTSFEEIGVGHFTFDNFNFNFENLKPLESMPNLRALYLSKCPRIMIRNYAKLERVRLELESDENVQTFISFASLNPQIKYLRLKIHNECTLQRGQIYSAIADHLTQLKTLKLITSPPVVTMPTFHFKTVESFSIDNLNGRFVFEFDDLKKLKLERCAALPLYLMDLAQRNSKLKVLKLRHPDRKFLDNGVIRNVLTELPELEQILVYGLKQHQYSLFKHHLGGKWEQFEKEGTVKFDPHPVEIYRRFRKINSKA